MSDLFISYSRHDHAFVQQLYQALKDSGHSIWIDWRSIPPSARWLEEIDLGIEQADIFLFIISPDSVGSSFCLHELNHAVTFRKRIIPVLFRQIASESLHPELASHQWLSFAGSPEQFHQSLYHLRESLERDIDSIHQATRLLGRARNWERHKYNSAYLLRHRELSEAEQWLIQEARHEPAPLPLYIEYIGLSRRLQNSRQRRTISLVMTGIILMSLLALLSSLLYGVTLRQYENLNQDAEHLRTLALLGYAHDNLAANALDRALLLNTLATQREDIPETRAGLFSAIDANPYLEKILQPPGTLPDDFDLSRYLAMSMHGDVVLSAGSEHDIMRWDTRTGKGEILVSHQKGDYLLEAIALSPDGTRAAFLRPGTLEIWDTQAKKRLASFEGISNVSGHPLQFSPDGKVLALLACDDLSCRTMSLNLIEVATQNILKGLPVTFPSSIHPSSSNQINANVFFNSMSDAIGMLVCVDACALAEESFQSTSVTFFSVPGNQFAPIASFVGNSDRIALYDSVSGLLHIWQTDTHTFLNQNEEPRFPRSDIDPSYAGFRATLRQDGQQILLPNHDGMLQLWDVTTGKARSAPLNGHLSSSEEVVMTPDGHYIATIEKDGQLLLWRTTPYSKTFIDQGMPTSTIIRFMPMLPPTLVVGNIETSVITFEDVLSGGIKAQIHLPEKEEIGDMAIRPDGKLLAVGTTSGKLITYRIESNPDEQLRVDQSHQWLLPFNPYFKKHPILNMFFGASGNRLFLEYELDGNYLLDIRGSAPRVIIQVGRLNLGTMSFNERYLVVKDDDGNLIIKDLLTQKVHMLNRACNEAFTFTPDSKQLACLLRNGKIVIWNTNTWTMVRSFQGPASRIEINVSLKTSTDGQFLIETHDHSVIIWDMRSPNINSYISPIALPGIAYQSAFSPDTHFLALSDKSGQVTVRPFGLTAWQQQACQIANRNLTSEEVQHYLQPEVLKTPVCTRR